MRTLWDFFNSLKLTVYLVLAMTALSMYGSFVIYFHPRIFGSMDMHIFFPFLFSVGINNFSQSWWLFLLIFIILLFGINTTVCTIERLPKVVKRYMEPLSNLREVEAGGEKGIAVELSGVELSARLEKNGYKVFAKDNLLFAEKNRWLPFLPYAVHIGVLLVLAAHLISAVSGYRHGGIKINEGETVRAPEGNYYLRLDKVRVDYRADGSLKDYGSELTALTGDGSVIKQAFAGANRPMFVRGGAVYQRDFGQDLNGIILKVSAKSGKSGGYLKILKGTDLTEIPGTNYRLRVDGFINDFALDESGQPYSQSDELANPAAMITLLKNGKPKSSGWIFLKMPQNDTFRDPDVDVRFADLDMLSYSVFDINRDPGALLALIASCIVMFGSIITLYFRRERVWAAFSGGKAQVVSSDEELYDKISSR
ncbi:MAG: cytochrome c biogenesis protein ResB [Nitrospirota bacterium]